MFDRKFDKFACEGDTITTTEGQFDITARIMRNDDIGEPWKWSDGHGPVSEWVRRGKNPGERMLCQDRGYYRYYDWQEAIKLAKKDGWDAPPYGTGTAGERAERAVKADFEAMRAWCNDEWFWCSIVLEVSKNGIVLDHCAASLGGIECNYPNSDNSYLTEVANELLPEAVKVGEAALESLMV